MIKAAAFDKNVPIEGFSRKSAN